MDLNPDHKPVDIGISTVDSRPSRVFPRPGAVASPGMNGWHFSWNLGMLGAAILLAVGGALMILPGEDSPTLRTAGFGIVVLSGVVYFVARVVQMIQERRK